MRSAPSAPKGARVEWGTNGARQSATSTARERGEDHATYQPLGVPGLGVREVRAAGPPWRCPLASSSRADRRDGMSALNAPSIVAKTEPIAALMRAPTRPSTTSAAGRFNSSPRRSLGRPAAVDNASLSHPPQNLADLPPGAQGRDLDGKARNLCLRQIFRNFHGVAPTGRHAEHPI